MRIRPATREDLDAIVPIWWDGLVWSVHDHPAFRPGLADRDAYRAHLARLLAGAGTVLVAEDEAGRLLGHCDLEAVRAPRGHYGDTPCAFLHDLDTADAARGSGIGQALLDAAIAWTRAQGLPRIELWAVAGRPRVADWYRRNGFAPSFECLSLPLDAPPS